VELACDLMNVRVDRLDLIDHTHRDGYSNKMYSSGGWDGMGRRGRRANALLSNLSASCVWYYSFMTSLWFASCVAGTDTQTDRQTEWPLQCIMRPHWLIGWPGDLRHGVTSMLMSTVEIGIEINY